MHRVLILEFVKRCWFWSGRREYRTARHFLIEMKPLHLGRERQVLDRHPAGRNSELRNVEVGIAGICPEAISDQRLARMAGSESGAIGPFGGGQAGGGEVVIG